MSLSRSEQMSHIRGRDTKPEILLRQALWQAGLRYRLHAVTPIGRPDMVFPTAKVAVFVDGCEWHGCPEHYVSPRTRREFWGAKLAENVARDQRQTQKLEAEGWRVVRAWEHEVFEAVEDVVSAISNALTDPTTPQSEALRVVRVDPLEGEGDLEQRHLQDLRDPTIQLVETRPRSTKKWRGRPSQG